MHVAKNAMAADGHVLFADYVPHYGHKKDAGKVPDTKTGKQKMVLKDISTWTWKLAGAASAGIIERQKNRARPRGI
jgi:hypothetical protein